jgi:20S proteasome alpha/beta subunit
MTIAAGFICTDGVVLASDTLYSGVNKQYGRKLWTFSFGQDTTIAIAGAGDAVLIKRAVDEISERLSRSIVSHRMVCDTADSVLYQLLHKYSPQASDEFKLSLLVGVRAESRCELYWSNGNAVLATLIGPATCIGWGNILGLYVVETLYAQPMPMKWAKIVAAHLIRLTKKHAADCGGDTHILALPLVGDVEFIETKSQIDDLEAYLGALDGTMRVVLPGTDLNATAESVIHRLQILIEAIRKASGLAVATANTGSIGITGAPVLSVIGERRTPLALATASSEPPSPVEPQSPESTTRDPKRRPPSPE